MSDKIEPMTLDRMRDLIEAYGAEPDRWPSSERERALLFLETSKEAQDILAESKVLDTALDALPEPDMSQGIKSRVLDAFTPANPIAANENVGLVAAITQWHPQSNGSWLRAAAAAIVFGVLCGVGGAQIFAPPSTVIITQPALPEFEPLIQNEVAALTLNGELPAILADTGAQPEPTNEDTEEDSEIPLI
ncbi:MAG: hypothetical protein GKS01_17885 [Alphaproteobacteria bacterium]|nr:hypothetical protein [Alphaproteobacteria bacterium]